MSCSKRDGRTMDTRKSHILLVEPDSDIREVIVRMLRKDASVLPTACEAGARMGARNGHRFNLVFIADYVRGCLDAKRLLRDLRGIESTKTARAVVLSSSCMPGDRERLLELGFEGFVEKPFQMATLLEEVRAASPTVG